MTASFVAARAARMDRLARESFDVLVVGGGINGCGIARDAAMRGLRVALVEKGDFAGGTSGRTSRLIHGGLRYLEHGHLRLVFEASRERRILLRIAPHLVHPLRFTWPIYERARLSGWKLAAGLTLYDALALFRNVGRHERLSSKEVTQREPVLRRRGLRGGATYFDAATDDARLTIANAVAAAHAGAVVVNYARHVPSGWDSRAKFRVVDALAGREMAVAAKVVVHAIGPWNEAARGTKGAHIAVPRERVPIGDAVAFTSPLDGRVVFLLPDGMLTIIGTTETVTAASPDDVRAAEMDVHYLIDSANAIIETQPLARTDVISAWAGIRPLAAGVERDDPGSASREHAIDSHGGEILVTGGKLTTYRAVAAEATNAVERALGRRPKRARSDRSRLPGTDREQRVAQAIARDRALGAPLAPSSRYRLADLVVGVEDELACTLGDLLIRRTRVAFQERDHGLSIAATAAECVAPLLGWDATARNVEIARYAGEVATMFAVEPI